MENSLMPVFPQNRPDCFFISWTQRAQTCQVRLPKGEGYESMFLKHLPGDPNGQPSLGTTTGKYFGCGQLLLRTFLLPLIKKPWVEQRWPLGAPEQSTLLPWLYRSWARWKPSEVNRIKANPFSLLAHSSLVPTFPKGTEMALLKDLFIRFKSNVCNLLVAICWQCRRPRFNP